MGNIWRLQDSEMPDENEMTAEELLAGDAAVDLGLTRGTTDAEIDDLAADWVRFVATEYPDLTVHGSFVQVLRWRRGLID